MLTAAQLNLEQDLGQAQSALASVLERATQGDPLTLLVLALAALLLVGITAKLTLFLWRVLKRVFLLGVAVYSLYYVYAFVSAEAAKVGGYEQLPLSTIALGALGLALGLITLVMGLASLFPSRLRRPAAVAPTPAVPSVPRVRAQARRPAPAGRYEQAATEIEKREEAELEWKARPAVPPAPVFEEEEEEPERLERIEESIAARVAAQLSKPVAAKEKSLLAVLAYLLVAEFGVFSSFTTAAPNPTVGLAFFVVFLGGALLFLRNNYKDYNQGLKHLGVAVLAGFALSVILGHYWNAIPLADLFSVKYFATSSLVALVTGVAVSLVLGSKG
jgi:hypothetical protein